MGGRTPMRDFDADSPQFRRPTESLPIISRYVEPESIFVLQKSSSHILTLDFNV